MRLALSRLHQCKLLARRCMDKNEEHKYCESGTPIGFFGTTMSVLDCYYDITGDWNRVCNCHVTHWMPLPDPPKEG